MRFSPHTRGCSQLGGQNILCCIVFPAYAGMFPKASRGLVIFGCFPRIRGDVPFADFSPSTGLKFSPHTRGCSAGAIGTSRQAAVFPAYAGMFLGGLTTGITSLGFPRIRGDVPTWMCWVKCLLLFSPHTRGCSVPAFLVVSSSHVFPAYAGMFLGPSRLSSRHIRFPRIRGDVPNHGRSRTYTPLFSPHTRGCSQGPVRCRI